jgi:hypothetical protein
VPSGGSARRPDAACELSSRLSRTSVAKRILFGHPDADPRHADPHAHASRDSHGDPDSHFNGDAGRNGNRNRDVRGDCDADSDSDGKPDPDADCNGNRNRDVRGDCDADSDSDGKPDPDTDCNGNRNGDARGDCDADSDSDGKPDPDADRNGNRNLDAHRNCDAGSHPHADLDAHRGGAVLRQRDQREWRGLRHREQLRSKQCRLRYSVRMLPLPARLPRATGGRVQQLPPRRECASADDPARCSRDVPRALRVTTSRP